MKKIYKHPPFPKSPSIKEFVDFEKECEELDNFNEDEEIRSLVLLRCVAANVNGISDKKTAEYQWILNHIKQLIIGVDLYDQNPEVQTSYIPLSVLKDSAAEKARAINKIIGKKIHESLPKFPF